MPPRFVYYLQDIDDVFTRERISCRTMNSDAQSAYSRAESAECKQAIERVSCLIAREKLFAKSLPRYCPLKGTRSSTNSFHCFGAVCYCFVRGGDDYSIILMLSVLRCTFPVLSAKEFLHSNYCTLNVVTVHSKRNFLHLKTSVTNCNHLS